jgi:hypothetical protein
MAERYERPAWVRRINAMADAVGGAERLVPIDADELIEKVSTSIGSEDFGDFGDAGWRKRFSGLVEAAAGANLHVMGRLMTREELMRSLCTRLLLAQARKDRPAIDAERIESPVVVTGPARSGTTILFELLSLDPGLRAPLAWEALHPVPRSGTQADHRLEISECEQELWTDVQPEFSSVHELRSDLPVECITLTAPSFAGAHWPMVMTLPGWAPDLPVMYRYHRSLLQTLQHGRPGTTWLLKTPGHLSTLALLFDTYPDAWVVQTHRDPVKTLPSTVSTVALIKWLRTDDVDVDEILDIVNLTFGAALLSVIEQRASGSVPDRFVDVHYQSLIDDPVQTLSAAYKQMGREFTPDQARRVTEYLAAKPKGKFGSHKYSPEEWGLDAAELRRRSRPYTDHYGVALEA